MVTGTVTVKELAEKMNLNNLTPELDLTSRIIDFYDVNRPALQLTGFFDHFDESRVQIVGYVEQEYMDTLTDDIIRERFQKLLSYRVPCIVFSRSYQPADYILSLCRTNGIPCLVSAKTTSDLSTEMVRWLKARLAPCISIHGVLVDVYGEGVLIMGDSGIGKSEAALELVKRGHRLVTDDVVEIRKVSDETLVGSAPSVTKNFIELRGIGIINVRNLFGFESVKDTQQIDMVIKLEEWNREKEYDRLGLQDHYTDFLGNKVICHEIPIRPGRNLAIIVECAAVNNRAKKMGHNAATELFQRVNANIGKDHKPLDPSKAGN